MKVSVILPTRKRVERLSRSIASLRDSARSADLEFCLGLDDDDRETAAWVESNPVPGLTALVGPRVGYANLHLYVNALALKASGEWLLLWNDDALMATEGWDEIVAGYTGQFLVLNPETNHGNQSKNQCIFPILPKGYVHVLGHVSLSNHYDTYVEWTANAVGIRRDVPIMITHDRPDLTGAETDSVYAEQTIQTGDFFGSENRRRISVDAGLLAGYLAQ